VNESIKLACADVCVACADAPRVMPELSKATASKTANERPSEAPERDTNRMRERVHLQGVAHGAVSDICGQ
jgi:hypothetical protein